MQPTIHIMNVSLRNWLLQNRNISFPMRDRVSIWLILFFLSFLDTRAQVVNYVNNGSFEILNANAAPYQWEATKYWGALDTTKGSNVLFSTLATISNSPYSSFGFQYPRTGSNFVGTQFYCNNCTNNPRLYPRNRLKQPLQVGKTYCAKYHVVNTNNCRVAIDKFGMYFGDTSLDTISKCTYPITYLNPQVENNIGIITDTLNWIAITGTFVANGTEKYLVLGNFRSNAATNTLQLNTPLSPQGTDIYIDDVSVIDIDLPAYAGPDVWGAPTTTVYLGRESDVGIDEACMWYKLPNTTTAIDTAAGITATVGVTTDTYVVRQEICGNVKWDTVTVNISGVGLSSHVTLSGVEGAVENNIRIYPNPSDKELAIETKQYKGEEFSLKILNGLGQTLREEEVVFKDNTISIQTSDLKNGIYFLNLSNNKLGSISKRFVIAQ